ncbi:MAG TPA: barstar family protein [Candidatus Sulfotelmatobacter sp.]|nr:barstar family protein [Candidatus Sulfotelmatobacter sp.]
MTPKVYEIDGSRFSTVEGFYYQVTRALGLPSQCGSNLDAFEDVLQGGFGTPEEGFVIRWKDYEISKRRLGYSETTRQLAMRLEKCDATARDEVSKRLELARLGQGPRAFDWLVEIIRDHGPGGRQEGDHVDLILD